ncbi:MAG: type III restriction endonuclease subunit R, partial [Bacteroidetes bacterium]|nr:type III restriction endonuclease subunit R [Bacteroidota bacterium]
MNTWYTTKPCNPTKRSHINHCVFDGTWEVEAANILDSRPEVKAWVKNDHLGFEILYSFRGVIRKYRPDFIVRLMSDDMLIVEIKGQENEETECKHKFMQQWIKAVNEHGGFGQWSFAISREPGQLHEILTELDHNTND